MRTILGEGKPKDRYGARSSDCHATNEHKGATNVRKLSRRTSGGASNLFAHEDLEHFEEAHHWNMQTKFYSERIPTS